jgi:betaine lipid synthase
VFLGCSRSRSTARSFKAFEIESGNTAGSGHATPVHSPFLVANVTSPRLSSTTATRTPLDMPELSLGPAALDGTPSLSVVRTGNSGKEKKPGEFVFPLSSFHYQHRAYRVPFLEKPEHGAFRTWIYGFTWEDPQVDMMHLGVNREDSLFVITSAGDSEYVLLVSFFYPFRRLL